MPGLMPTDLHVDQYLTNILIGYKPQGLVADQLFPVIQVNKQTNLYATIERGNWFRRPNTQRSPGNKPREVSFTVGSGQYVAKNYALGERVAFETIDNADDPFKPLQQAGEHLIDQLLIDFEVRVSQVAYTGVGSTTTLTPGGSTAWDDFANSDPIGDVEVAQEAIRKTTGYKPNFCLIGYRSWLKMRRHPDLIRAASRLGEAGVGGLITPEQFGQLVMVDKVIVAEPIINTAEEGQADAFTDVWSTNVLLAYITPKPGLMVPTYGYSFRWTGPNIGKGAPGNFSMLRLRDEVSGSEYMQTGYYQDEKIVAPELGFLIKTGIQ